MVNMNRTETEPTVKAEPTCPTAVARGAGAHLCVGKEITELIAHPDFLDSWGDHIDNCESCFQAFSSAVSEEPTLDLAASVLAELDSMNLQESTRSSSGDNAGEKGIQEQEADRCRVRRRANQEEPRPHHGGADRGTEARPETLGRGIQRWHETGDLKYLEPVVPILSAKLQRDLRPHLRPDLDAYEVVNEAWIRLLSDEFAAFVPRESPEETFWSLRRWLKVCALHRARDIMRRTVDQPLRTEGDGAWNTNDGDSLLREDAVDVFRHHLGDALRLIGPAVHRAKLYMATRAPLAQRLYWKAMLDQGLCEDPVPIRRRLKLSVEAARKRRSRTLLLALDVLIRELEEEARLRKEHGKSDWLALSSLVADLKEKAKPGTLSAADNQRKRRPNYREVEEVISVLMAA